MSDQQQDPQQGLQQLSQQDDQALPQQPAADPLKMLEEMIAKRKGAAGGAGAPGALAMPGESEADSAKAEEAKAAEEAAAKAKAEEERIAFELAQEQAKERDQAKIVEQKQAIQEMSHSETFQTIDAQDQEEENELASQKAANDGYEVEQITHQSS